jgi:hypothetical protein
LHRNPARPAPRRAVYFYQTRRPVATGLRSPTFVGAGCPLFGN